MQCSRRPIGKADLALSLLLYAAGGCHAPGLASSDPTRIEPADSVAITREEGARMPFTWGRTWAVESADFNGDGLTDLLVTTHESRRHPDGIWIQAPDGSFRTGFEAKPDSYDRHGCTIGDVNGDGLEDFYCQSGVSRGTATRPNELWIQQAGGGFADRAAAWGVTDERGRGRRPIFYDHDGDGRLDLYTTVWGERADTGTNRNRLWVNRGSHFVEQRTVATESDVGSRCVDAGDIDVDGREDLVVCGDRLRLFRSNGDAGHVDASEALGGPVVWPQDAVLADLDADGLLDLVVVLVRALEIRMNRGGRFATVHARIGLEAGSRATVADLTGDELPDIYVTQGCREGRNWFDKLLAAPHWEAVALDPNPGVGCGNIPVVIGGRVLVFSGGPSWEGPVAWRRPD